MVEADDQDALRRGPEHADEVGAAVDHHPGLAGTRAGEHQHVGFIACGNHLHLDRVAEILHDPLVGGFARRPFEHLFSSRKVSLDEGRLIHGEIGQHQLERPAHGPQPEPRVFVHDMDLEGPFPIVLRQGFVIGVGVTASGLLRQDADAHGLAKDGQPLLEDDRLLFVQEHQAAVDGGQRVLDLGKKEVRPERVGQVVGGKAHQQFGTRRLLGRDAREQGFEQESRNAPSFF